MTVELVLGAALLVLVGWVAAMRRSTAKVPTMTDEQLVEHLNRQSRSRRNLDEWRAGYVTSRSMTNALVLWYAFTLGVFLLALAGVADALGSGMIPLRYALVAADSAAAAYAVGYYHRVWRPAVSARLGAGGGG